MNFNKEIQKILEGHNVYPRAKSIQGRQAPVPSKNIIHHGAAPSGFKGSGPAGLSPSSTSQVLIKWPKKKKKIKKKKDFSS